MNELDLTAVLTEGRDGIIICIDLNTAAGERAVAILKRDCPGIAMAIQVAEDSDLSLTDPLGGEIRYMLVLDANDSDVQTVMLATEQMLSTAIAAMQDRTSECGEMFSVIVIPDNPTFISMFHRFDIVGNA